MIGACDRWADEPAQSPMRPSKGALSAFGAAG
jgi:hypothetical protein